MTLNWRATRCVFCAMICGWNIFIYLFFFKLQTAEVFASGSAIIFLHVCMCVCVGVCVWWGDSVHANVPLRHNRICSFVFPHLYVCHLTLPKTHLNTVLHLALTWVLSPPSLSPASSLSILLSYFLWYNRGRGGDTSPCGCWLGSCYLPSHLCTTDLFSYCHQLSIKGQMESEE